MKPPRRCRLCRKPTARGFLTRVPERWMAARGFKPVRALVCAGCLVAYPEQEGAA